MFKHLLIARRDHCGPVYRKHINIDIKSTKICLTLINHPKERFYFGGVIINPQDIKTAVMVVRELH